MAEIPFLDGDAIRTAIDIGEMLDAVEGAYRDVASGRDQSPLRSRVAAPNGDLLLMPGVREGASGTSVKLVTVSPRNAQRGLPTIHAIVVWFDGETGRPAALIDGETLTAMRTGAASGVATRLMARPDAATLALFGAGGQAEWQLRAVLAARPLTEARVYTRSASSRAAFAERMTDACGLPVLPAASPAETLAGADVVCCATTSSVPIFEADDVAEGAHVNAIGAFRRGMVELPPALFRRADLVAVDARHAAMEEAGDVLAAIEAGELGEDDLVEVGSVDAGYAESRAPNAVTVFKSVGLAIQDVAAAELIVRRLL